MGEQCGSFLIGELTSLPLWGGSGWGFSLWGGSGWGPFLAAHWLDMLTTALGLAYIILEYHASIWLWLVGFLMHEIETVLLGIEELVGTALDLDGLDLGTCGEGILQDAAVLQVAEFGLYESGTLARFYVLEIHYHTGLVVILDVKAVLEICSCCHKYVFFNMISLSAQK